MVNQFEYRWPNARITVRDGGLTIVEARQLQSRMGMVGAASRRLAQKGIYLADVFELERSDDHWIVGEIFIKFLADGDGVPDAKNVIAEWARSVGRTRVWFSDEVRDLRGAGAQCGTASVECPTCTEVWLEGGVEFWQMVRNQGEFPSTCLLCGCLLPQWTVESGAAEIPAAWSGIPTHLASLFEDKEA